MYSNICLGIYIFAWCFLLKKQMKFASGGYLNVSSYVIVLYVLWGVMSYFLYNSPWFNINCTNTSISILPLAYLFFMVLLFIWPVIRYDRDEVKAIQIPSNWILYVFLLLYGIATALSLPSRLSEFQDGMAVLFSSDMGGANLYDERAMEMGGEGPKDNSLSGLWGMFCVFRTAFSDVGILIFFFYLSLPNKSRWIVIYFGLVFFLDLFLCFAVGGRTPFVTNLLTYGLSFFLFRNYWTPKIRYWANRVSLIVLALSAIPFSILSSSRFGGNLHQGGTLGGIVVYAGQSVLNFDKYAFYVSDVRNGDRTVNLLKSWMGYDVPSGVLDARMKYWYMDLGDESFSTFVGDFVLDFGLLVTMLIFGCLSFALMRITKVSSSTMNFHQMVALFFVLCVSTQGSMYLFNYSFESNWKIIGFVLAYMVFLFDYGLMRRPRIIHKRL